MNSLFKIGIALIVCFQVNNLFAQVYISDTSSYKYFIGTQEPTAGWKQKTFSDKSWLKGKGGIGFGYGNATQLTKFKGALYLRIPFKMEDISILQELVLLSDFDDAFVAYINGVEVLRTNIGKRGDAIPFDRLADRSKEAYFYRDFEYPVPGYTIDMGLAKSALTLGDNMLAIQIHNDSINGSDLTYMCWMYNYWRDYFAVYSIDSHYYQQVELENSKFPIVSINTDEFGLPLTHVEYPAKMEIIGGVTGVNDPDDVPSFSGSINIERRGESSSHLAKWSFNVETVDASGESLDTSLLGFPSDNDWILFSAFADKSMIRNEICFGLGRKMGHYEPRTQFCELIYNGEYQGLYVFMEKIKRGKKRVNVSKAIEGAAPENIGYVFKYDKPSSSLQFVYPKNKDISLDQADYIKNYMAEFYAVLRTPNFIDPENGYKKYINPSSLLDYLVVNELTKNADSYLYSTYLHKDKFDKVNYGPLWDYDLAFGNTLWQNGNLTYGWQFVTNKVLNIHLIMADPEFVQYFAQRWKELRKSYLHTDSIFSNIDHLVEKIKDSRELNYKVWHTLEVELLNPAYKVQNYEQEIDSLKNYIKLRAAWIDANIDEIYYPLPSDVNYAHSYRKLSIDIYPNPAVELLNIKFQSPSDGQYTIQIKDLNGRQMLVSNLYGTENQVQTIHFNAGQLASLRSGIYFVTILKDGNILASEKFVKASK